MVNLDRSWSGAAVCKARRVRAENYGDGTRASDNIECGSGAKDLFHLPIDQTVEIGVGVEL
ncbi:MAG: hypothetical protein ABI862_05240 [Ilumatobacteraceae bacterium]